MKPQEYQSTMINTVILLFFLFLFIYISFNIIRPFVSMIAWAAIIATAMYPVHEKLMPRVGGKSGRSAFLVTLMLLVALIIPTWLLMDSLIETTETLSQDLSDGSLTIPAPSDQVAELPVVGEKLFAAWTDASVNLEGFLNKYQEQLKSISAKLVSAAAVTVKNMLAFVVSIIIAGVLLKKAESCSRFVDQFSRRLLGSEGTKLVAIACATVRSVAKGVLGTALIQTILGTLGMLVVGVPGVGLWAILVLLVAVVQLPPILILGPIAVYVYSIESAGVATAFLVYSLIVSSSDAVLKPLLLGRGVEIPMLVILIGAIGGMILSGIVGLFAGAVVLTLTYKLLSTWLEQIPDTAGESGVQGD
jgi:predicted PurR-regulated permease PerM